MVNTSLSETPHPLFNDLRHADVVLRSSNAIDFYVHRHFLSSILPVFRDMFSLPTPIFDTHSNHIINVSESSHEVELMLKFCHPFMDVDIQSIEVVQSLLGLTQKYDIEAGFN